MFCEVQALPHYIYKLEMLQLQHPQMLLSAWLVTTTVEAALNS